MEHISSSHFLAVGAVSFLVWLAMAVDFMSAKWLPLSFQPGTTRRGSGRLALAEDGEPEDF